MKTFFASILILACAALASAQTFKALTVSNVVRTADNTYTAEKDTNDTHGEASAADIVGRYLTLKTSGCKHDPAAGTTAIYLRPASGSDRIIFSDGGTCTVATVTSTDTATKKQ